MKKKEEKYGEITLLEEDEREGQTAAQNRILSRASGDCLVLMDGDGTIEPGSLETLYSSFNGDNIPVGREVRVTEDSFLGELIDLYGELHHRLSLSNPNFSTQISIIPGDLVDSLPEIVLDDAYIEHRAISDGLEISYIPEAVKYHHVPNTLRFFFNQQKKNWAGRFQAEQLGYIHTKPDRLLLKMFLKELSRADPREIPVLAALALVEFSAYIGGRFHQLTGNFPVKWWRP